MDLKELAGLSTEQKFKVAADYAGIPVEVLDRQWTTESGRGTNLTGPETKWGRAKGHFQFIDDTAKAVQAKVGVPYDPENLDVGLLYAATLWKENMGRYGNVPEAAAAYHGGADQANWGPVTRDYVRKLTGGDVTGKPSVTMQSRADIAGTVANVSRLEKVTGEFGSRDATDKLIDDEERRSNAGYFASLGAALESPDVVMAWWLVDQFTQEREDAPAGWSYDNVAATVEKGRSEEDRAALREMGSTGPQALQRAVAYVDQRAATNKVFADSGAFMATLGALTAGVADPAGWAVGLGVGKALQLAGVGSRALVAAGRGGAAVASNVAENVAGNLLLEGGADVLGKPSTREDYLFAGVAAAGISALTARGTIRGAHEAKLAADIHEAGRRALDGTVVPKDSAEAKVIADRQAVEISQSVHTRNDGADVVVPTTLRQTIADLADGKATDELSPVKEVVPEKPAVTTPDAPPPVKVLADAETAAFLDKLDKTATKRTPAQSVNEFHKFLGEDGVDLDSLSPQVRERLESGYLRAMDKLVEADLPDGVPVPGSTSLTSDGEPLVISGGYHPAFRNAAWVADEAAKTGNVHLTLLDQARSNKVATAKSEDVLTHIARNGNDVDSRFAKWLLEVGGPALKTTEIWFSDLSKITVPKWKGRAFASDVADVVVMNTDSTGKRTMSNLLPAGNSHSIALHEVLHSVTVTVLRAIKDAVDTNVLGNIHPDAVAAYRALDDMRLRVRHMLKKSGRDLTAQHGATYAARDIYEFTAQLMNDHETRRILTAMPASPSFGGRYSNALREAVGYLKTMLGLASKKPNTMFDEAMANIENLILRRDEPIVNRGGIARVAGAPLPDGGEAWPGNLPSPQGASTFNPNAVNLTRRNLAATMYAHAATFIQANPINMDRLKVLTARFGAMSDGLKLAASKDPILQMVASLITETTTGAAGRKVTAALRKVQLQRVLMGDVLPQYEGTFETWAATNGGTVMNKWVTGDKKREFDQLVYTEIVSRRVGGTLTQDPSIRRAADVVRPAMERALKAQVDANVLGAKYLPSNSEGYIPQALNGKVLATIDHAERQLLVDHLSSHWLNVGIASNRVWANEFAQFYLDRSMARAMGGRGIDLSMQGSSSGDIIRETLESMASTPGHASAATQALARLSQHGAGQTKTRLDVDLLATLPNGKRVMDYYETNVMDLVRRYMDRTSGTVALTEFNILGAHGAKYLREAIQVGDGSANRATLAEIEAFDRIMSEMLGGQIEGATRSQVATNLRMLTSVQRLGSATWNQLAETSNLGTTLGITSLLKGIASLPKMIGEVGRVAKGQSANNHILHSFEQVGGTIGMDDFRLTIPIDAPDQALAHMSSDPGITTRLLGAGVHLQSKLSFWRGLNAAQHRMVAEQIVLKAVRYVKDMQGNPRHLTALKDMGFNDALLAQLHQNLNRFVTFDAAGNVQALDITQLPNMQAAIDFTAAVQRGTSQIIQGTFIGEKSAWLHNDWAKLGLQFRTFGLTATEKQWGRQRMNHGYGYAAGLMLGQMAFAIPLYASRVQLASVGREDKDKFIKDALSPYAMTRALMNYSSLSSLGGDVIDATAAIGGGWSDNVADAVGPVAGTVGGGLAVGKLIPSTGSLDAAGRTLTGNATLYQSLKQLPFSNHPLIIPVINLTK